MIRAGQGHFPPAPPAIGFASAIPQASVHVALAAHVMEHELVQVMAHVEPGAHVTLPLSPTVAVQLAPVPQSTLQDLPHAPVQLDASLQTSEQLSAAWH